MNSSDLPRPFGPYTLLRRLAAGGMAEVYLAKSEGAVGFEKLVALKRIHPRYALDEGFGQMLLDEARLSASLSHRNIVQTLDLGRVEGSYVIVMEYVDGYDAHHVLDRLRSEGRLFPIDLASYVIAELCRGLDYAHGHRDAKGLRSGIVHRDVSPQNLLLSFAGEVKIADFGIAKASSSRRHSEAGVIKGKYYYMSPEQARAEPLDHRSDIFSAGVVFWELLVGERLHAEGDVRSLIQSVRKAEVPPPSALRRQVPAELDAIVARATAANAEDRYEHAGAMADDLLAYLARRPPVHASRQLQVLLTSVPPPSAPPEEAPLGIPQTRDRVVTSAAVDLTTPPEAPLRYDLDDGEPTLSGLRSPGARSARLQWPWFLAAGIALAATVTVAWFLHGF
jgi:serine/threonine protein kinase